MSAILGGPSAVARPIAPARTGGEMRAFIARLHFYVGLFVGPFLLVAAVTGVLYVLTPQIEDALYRSTLRTEATGPAHSLADQVAAARGVAGPDLRLLAVRPAVDATHTTRVMFAAPGLGESESRAVFVDPATLRVTGDLIVYGTSGILPFRTTLDYLHRSLLLGDAGRFYSELAASWLWIAALGGILLWAWRQTGRLSRQNPRNARLRARRLHGLFGVAVSVGLLFLSATGLTWSRWAGGRIDSFREAVGWVTPSVTLALPPATGQAIPASTAAESAAMEHAMMGHESGDPAAMARGTEDGAGAAMPGMTMPMPAMADHAHGHGSAAPGAPSATAGEGFDAALAAARVAGIDSPMVEIRPPQPDKAWLVREYDRSWPTQVDTVTLDPTTLAVTSRADFASFPLVAKLIRWGIDLHMGVLFGLWSQLLMAGVGLGLVAATLYGYRVWWQNRPAPGSLPRTLVASWLRLGFAERLSVATVAVALGWALPAMGLSLVAFLLVDVARWRLVRPAVQAVAAE